MKLSKLSNEGVSPVVGVMLMLVVTIIIAAVVSGFAGSMAESVTTTPQATIKATYSQANGMTITHAGGDSLLLSDLKFATMPGEVMGPDYLQFMYVIDPVALNYTTSAGVDKAVMDNTTGFYNKASFKPGDLITISQAMCKDRPVGTTEIDAVDAASRNNPYKGYGKVNTNAALFWGNLSTTKGLYFSGYQFMYPENVGNYFYLIVSDKNGNTISKEKVTIQA